MFRIRSKFRIYQIFLTNEKKEEKNHLWLSINILVRPELVTQKKLNENEVQPRKYKQEKKSKQLESACRLI